MNLTPIFYIALSIHPYQILNASLRLQQMQNGQLVPTNGKVGGNLVRYQQLQSQQLLHWLRGPVLELVSIIMCHNNWNKILMICCFVNIACLMYNNSVNILTPNPCFLFLHLYFSHFVRNKISVLLKRFYRVQVTYVISLKVLSKG